MRRVSDHAAQRPVTVALAVTQHLKFGPVPHIFQTPVDLCRLANEACKVMICMLPTSYNGPVMTEGFFAPPLVSPMVSATVIPENQ